jgi:hypothetical protein
MDSSARIRDVSVNPNNPYKEEGVSPESVKPQIDIFLLAGNRLRATHRSPPRYDSRCDAFKSRCSANDIVEYAGLSSPAFLPPRRKRWASHCQHGVMAQILRDEIYRLSPTNNWRGELPN